MNFMVIVCVTEFNSKARDLVMSGIICNKNENVMPQLDIPI